MCSDYYQQSSKPSVGYCDLCNNPIDDDGVSTAESCHWSKPDPEPCPKCGYDFAYCDGSC